MNKTILVTGGAGYLGSWVSSLLLDEGYRVRVLDSLLFGDEGIKHLYSNPNFELFRGDIRHIDDLALAMPGVDSVLHLAAIVGDPACKVNEDVTRTVNSEATKILVELCNYYKISSLIFASSCSVYGATDDMVLNEGSLVSPLSLYAESRIESENIIFTRSRKELAPTSLRLGTLFGLSRRMRYDLVINVMTARALKDREIKVWGGDQWRPIVHVRDAARAFVRVLDSPRELVDREIYNVGSNSQNYTIHQMADMVQEVIGNLQVQMFEGNLEDRRNYRVSFDKIRHVLGYQTEHSVIDGIREIVSYIRAERDGDYQAEKYHNNKYAYRLVAYK